MRRVIDNHASESFEVAGILKQTERKGTENGVASAIRILAWLTAIGWFILGIVLGRDPISEEFSFMLAIFYWAVGLEIGIILWGFSEIIRLLQWNATKEYKIFFDKKLLLPPKNSTQKAIVDSNSEKVEEVAVTLENTEKGLLCPLCNTKMTRFANQATCFNCGAKFDLDDGSQM